MGRQPSVLQLAQYGETALVVRQAMKAKNLTAKQVNQALGQKLANTAIYQICNGKLPVGPRLRPKLAKVLGISESSLLPKPVLSGQEATALVIPARDAPGRDIASSVPRKAGNSLLSFTVDQAGMAHMAFNLSLPLAMALDLLNHLQAQGLLVPTTTE